MSDQLQQVAAKIKIILTDVDGVFTALNLNAFRYWMGPEWHLPERPV